MREKRKRRREREREKIKQSAGGTNGRGEHCVCVCVCVYVCGYLSLKKRPRGMNETMEKKICIYIYMYSEKTRDGFRPVANTAPRDASDCCKQERVGVGRPPGLLFPPCDRSSFRVGSEREKKIDRERVCSL